MSKGFKCDNCLECFAGDPAFTDENHNDFCHNCMRAISVLCKIDPFAYTKQKEKEK